ncbi:MAG: UBP-type zinc finger domain-containing protein [Steroidobacteraceae bacterium]
MTRIRIAFDRALRSAGRRLAIGDSWVHLRLCRTCGHVGCCDDSKNRHARRHFLEHKHPIISSFEPGEDWSWCFIDEIEVLVT